MAWRPHEYLIEGELDNSVPGKVTGWLKFAGMKETVNLDLTGDFHPDIRRTKVHLRNPNPGQGGDHAKYMKGFSPIQTGQVVCMTAGLPQKGDRAYFEWDSKENRGVVLILGTEQVQVAHVSRRSHSGGSRDMPQGSGRSAVLGTEATLPGDTPGPTALGRVAEMN
jgi:hypothetical protein